MAGGGYRGGIGIKRQGESVNADFPLLACFLLSLDELFHWFIRVPFLKSETETMN